MAGLKLGEHARLFVGVEGPLTAFTESTVTIGGHTLPFALGNGVVHLSTVEPPRPLPYVAPGVRYVNDGSCDCDGTDAVAPIVEAAHRAHDDAHVGNFAYCDNPICKAVREEANC